MQKNYFRHRNHAGNTKPRHECLTFDAMELVEAKTVVVEQALLSSRFLKRDVVVDFYLPKNISEPTSLPLLLINDGQDLPKMNFAGMLDALISEKKIEPVFCAGVHAGVERKMEYGTVNYLDYEGRGAKAKQYERFILEELLPYIHDTYKIPSFQKRAFAGFSLGGLMALDIVWRHPDLFSIAAVFSGSLWWRLKALNKGYNEATDRIMHKQIREGHFHPGQKFYFTTGSLDETCDRNHNGIIDSIDDTLGLIEELKKLGYTDADICYINYEDGRHDVPTWGRALPHFLIWAFEKVDHGL